MLQFSYLICYVMWPSELNISWLKQKNIVSLPYANIGATGKINKWLTFSELLFYDVETRPINDCWLPMQHIREVLDTFIDLCNFGPGIFAPETPQGIRVDLVMKQNDKWHGTPETKRNLIKARWGWDNVVDIFHTPFSNAFSWMKTFEFWNTIQLKDVPWALIDYITALVQLTANVWSNDEPVHWRIRHPAPMS